MDSLKQQLSNDKWDIKNKNQMTNAQLTIDEAGVCDLELSNYKDLMDPQFYAWHCKVWYKIGREKYTQLASQARADGKNPAKLFTYLLRRELRKASVHNY